MANQQSQIVSIDGVEYKVEDMTEQQQMLLNHVVDLDRKINSTKFQLDQLNVGKEAFFTMLKQQLTPAEESVGLTD
jgi:TFIIF-interacting CTD phosphatase-like protein